MLWLFFVGLACAIDCKKLGLDHLNHHYIFEQTVSTPPTETKETAHFNPCAPVNVPECASDANFCLISSINVNGNSVVANVKNYGSRSAGAKEEFTKSSPGNDELVFSYTGAKWGDRTLQGNVRIACGQGDTSFTDWEYGADLFIGDGVLCDQTNGNDGSNDGSNNGDSGDEKSPKAPRHGWGFFRWLFFLVLVGSVLYALLTVYINVAQSRGTIPLAANISDVLRDLPYLIRDVIRKIKAGFSSSSRSGYSAL